MAKTWYTSDIHFGHVNILDYCVSRRTYLGLDANAGVTDMNEALVRLWNNQVEYDDTVLILGDLCMGKVAETLAYVARLNGDKFLVPGNHDRMHPIMFKSDEKTAAWVHAYNDVGVNVLDIGPFMWKFDGVDAAVSHFPYEADHTEDARYGDWRPSDHGLPLVHGHVHDLFQTSGRQYNVGIDAWNGEFRTAEQIGDYFRSVGAG
jgi:calcineurin-like phosphoesterase family protein